MGCFFVPFLFLKWIFMNSNALWRLRVDANSYFTNFIFTVAERVNSLETPSKCKFFCWCSIIVCLFNKYVCHFYLQTFMENINKYRILVSFHFYAAMLLLSRDLTRSALLLSIVSWCIIPYSASLISGLSNTKNIVQIDKVLPEIQTNIGIEVYKV